MKKETIFKVGDRPKWTPELIKQLPHGTVLECAMSPEDTFVYQGNDLTTPSEWLGFYEDDPIKGHKRYMWFTYTNKFAKIISLPETKSIKEKLKGTCVLNESKEMGAEIIKLYTEAGVINDNGLTGEFINGYYGEEGGIILCFKSSESFTSVLTLDQLRSIVRGEKGTVLDAFNSYHEKEIEKLRKVKAESVELKEGEETDQGVLIHKHQGKAWVIKEGQSFGCLVPLSSLRKIDPDSDLKNIADEVMSRTNLACIFRNLQAQTVPEARDKIKSMLIEAMKRVKK